MLEKCVPPATAVGVVDAPCDAPVPSWPALLAPQQYVPPTNAMRQVWAPPAAIVDRPLATTMSGAGAGGSGIVAGMFACALSGTTEPAAALLAAPRNGVGAGTFAVVLAVVLAVVFAGVLALESCVAAAPFALESASA
jgi:hypothetical protein